MNIRDTINKLEEWTVVISIAGMTIMAFVQVVVRYVLELPLMGPDEISRTFQVILTYIGCAIAVREGSQISIDIMEIIFKRPVLQKIINIIVNFIGIIFTIVFVYFFFGLFTYSFEAQQASVYLRIPLAIPKGSMFVGLLLMLVHYLERIFIEIKYLSSIIKDQTQEKVSNEIV